MNSLFSKLKVNPNLKILVVPSFAIVVVLILIVTFAPQTIPQINKKMEELKKNRSQEEVLNEKLTSLKKISPNLLDPEDITVIALPSKNPVVWVISHIKKLAEEYEIQINKIAMESGKGDSDLKSSGVSFEFETSDYVTFMSFAGDLTQILPVTLLENISLERKSAGEGGSVYAGGVNVSFFWSDFPKTLPALTQPVNELTNEDMNLIGAVSKYKSPSFIDLPPSEPRDRPQPFN